MWLCGGNSRIFRTGLSHENDGDARLITKGYKLQNLAVLEFFFFQLFPNWTACSLITYTIQYTHNASEGSGKHCSLLSVTFP